MRKVAVGLGLVILVLPGCDPWKNIRPDPRGPANPAVGTDAPPPQAQRLVAYLNDNAKRIQAVQANDIDIDCREGIRSVGLHAKMVCQKPKYFRLKADLMGKPGVDLGSNEDEFWFWISQEKPPYVFHCAYNDLRNGPVKLPFPFQPDMVVCALGIGEYDTSKNYKLETRKDTLELIEPALSPQGKPITKVTVFNRWEAKPPKPQVVAYILRDEKGKEICSAHIMDVTFDQATNAILPRIVRLTWPEQKLEMTMKMRDAHSTHLEMERATALFSRQDLSNFPSFDLGRQKEDRAEGFTQGTGLQKVRGAMPVPR